MIHGFGTLNVLRQSGIMMPQAKTHSYAALSAKRTAHEVQFDMDLRRHGGGSHPATGLSETHTPMSEVAVHRFHGLNAELVTRIEQTLRDFAAENGKVFQPGDMHQGDSSIENLAHDALTFGMDVWTQGSGGTDDRLGDNVVTLPVVERSRGRLAGFLGTRLAMAAVGAVALAAATTESIQIPGAERVAHYVYLNNMPETVTRIIERNGRYYRSTVQRTRGEPLGLIHQTSFAEITAEQALSPDATSTSYPTLWADSAHPDRG